MQRTHQPALSITAAVSLFATSMAAQGAVWIVDNSPTASPTDFQSIVAAVDQSSVGDTIRIRPGTYFEPTNLVIDKGISIIADPGAIYYNDNNTGSVITIRDLPADETFSIRGLNCIHRAIGYYFPSPLLAENCEGLVSFTDLTPGQASDDRDGLWFQIRDCAQFYIEGTIGLRCALSIERSRGAVTRMYTLKAIQNFEDSYVRLDQCSFRRSDDGFLGTALFAINSTIEASRSKFDTNSPWVSPVSLNNATLITDPETMFLAEPGVDPISGTMFTHLVEPLTGLSTEVSGQTLALDLHAEVGDSLATLLSLPVPTQPTPFGDLWVDPVQHLVLDLAQLTQPTRNVDIPLDLGIPPGLSFALQSVSVGSAIRLSNGAVFSTQ